MFTDISPGRTEHRWAEDWEDNIKCRRAMNLLSRKSVFFLIYVFITFLADGEIRNQCVTSSLHIEELEWALPAADGMGRKDGVTCFQKQKALIVSNVDELQQSTEMVRRKVEWALFFLIRFLDISLLAAFSLSVPFFVLPPAHFFHMTSGPLILCIGFHFR